MKGDKNSLSAVIINEFYDAIEDLDYTKVTQMINKFEISLDDLNHHEQGYPLCYAIEKADIKMVQILIENGASVNIMDNDTKMQPLFLAIINAKTDIAKLLIENGAKIGIKRLYCQALRFIIKNKMTSMMQAMINQGISSEFEDEIDENEDIKLLFLSIKMKSKPVLELMIKHLNIDINKKYMDHSPISYALSVGNIKILNYLYKNGATFDDKFLLELELRSLSFNPNLPEPIQRADQNVSAREIAFDYARTSVISRVNNQRAIDILITR